MSILEKIPADLAHALAPVYFELASRLLGPVDAGSPLGMEWRGKRYLNPIGNAGGFDKNGDMLLALQGLGCGFLEVGTVTPRPQLANTGRVVGRDWNTQSLWNRLGFPNLGASELSFQLARLEGHLSCPLWINIGKNRDTPLAEARKDYAICAKKLSIFADAFVINVSSPNTQGLRDLQEDEALYRILMAVREVTSQPVLVKLSPDLSDKSLLHTLDLCLQWSVDGVVLTNTTQVREANSRWPAEGGVSGAPLRARSENVLELALRHLGPNSNKLLLVSVGGVLTPEDVVKRLKMGAHLVQSYSGLVFYGVRFFRDSLRLLNRP